LFYICVIAHCKFKTMKESREALNERFKSAFKYLEDQGIIVRNSHSKGLSAISDKIFGRRAHGHIILKYLNDERLISFEAADKFCDAYQISKEFMFQGEGEISVQTKKTVSNLQDAVEESLFARVLYTSVPALAGSSTSAGSAEQNSFIQLPGVQDKDLVAFSIQGNSMQPTLINGDIVIAKQMDIMDQVNEQDVYAVVTHEGVMVKRIKKMFKNDKLVQLKLISDNYFDHDPFYVDIQQLKKIYKVVKRLSDIGKM